LKIAAFIEKHRLLSPGATVIVGFSGGADSVALLHVLHRLGYKCIAAHCNFHLRGAESLRDETFACNFAQSLHIPVEKADFDTRRYASEQHISIEMAARDLRYAWFETLRVNCQAEAIAVAHHQDDSVETVLLNLIRSTGIRGLSGIRVRSGAVVRPLLGVDKKEILAYIREHRLDFVTDSSNRTLEYTRNIIRLQVLPLLQTINPSVTEAIERTADHLSQVVKVYEAAIDQAKSTVLASGDNGAIRIDIKKIQTFPSPEALLYEILSGYGFNDSVIRDIGDALNGQAGKLFYAPSHRLVKDREWLIIHPIDAAPTPDVSFDVPETMERMTIPLSLTLSLTMETLAYSPDFPFSSDKSVAYFDKDKLRFPLQLRKWREGDVFVPFGMKGKQKVGKYFKDHLFSRLQKEAAWLLCSGDDIIWIVNERSDNRYRTGQGTRSVLILKVNRSL
jgi:tRNA(Ile)-lysidine synthase